MAAVPRLERIHATAIAAGGKAAIIRGPSGAGKSDLALRCLALAPSALLPHPAQLVADDYCELNVSGGLLKVRAPGTLSGKLEVRGLGIMDVAVCPEAEAVLAVDLVQAPEAIDRLPDPIPHTLILGLRLPLLRLDPFESSAPIKLLLALHARWGS